MLEGFSQFQKGHRRSKLKARHIIAVCGVLFIVAIGFLTLQNRKNTASSDQIAISEQVKGRSVSPKSSLAGRRVGSPVQDVKFFGSASQELGASAKELLGSDQAFRSVRDGFSFANYSGEPTNDRIDASTMAALFGSSAVCVDPNSGYCVILPGAQAVADQLNMAMSTGRCEGLAVLSQRFYDSLELRPEGATATFQLPQRVVAKQIGYWWATQVAPSVAENSQNIANLYLRRL